MRIEIPDDKRLTMQTIMDVRWGDMDFMGHVNNTVYFRYFETVRIEYLYSLGKGPAPAQYSFVVINAFCNYYRQLEFPRKILIKHYVGAVGTTSFDAYLTLEPCDEPGVIYTAGGATTVWIDVDKQKSAPLPNDLRAKLLAGSQ